MPPAEFEQQYYQVQDSRHGGAASQARLCRRNDLTWRPGRIKRRTAVVLLDERNLLISGSTGSGKITLLNALVSLLPAEGCTISIEDTLELRLRRTDCLRFEARGRRWMGDV